MLGTMPGIFAIFLFSVHVCIAEPSMQDVRLVSSLRVARDTQPSFRPEPLNKFINTTFHCSEMEKICLQNNRVLHAPSSKCYRVPDSRPCNEGTFVVSKKSFVNEKRIIGKCLDYCSGTSAHADEECIPSKECELGESNANEFQEELEDMFGEQLCCNEESCILDAVPQPMAEDSCALSNIKDNAKKYDPDSRKLEFLHCSEQDLECFKKNMFYHPTEGCVKPLGKCQNDGKWQADSKIWKEELRLEAKCVTSLCSSGDIFVVEEQRCVSTWEVKNVLCTADHVFFDIFGEAFCDRYNFDRRLLNLSLIHSISNGMCKVSQEPSHVFTNNAHKVCAEDNSGNCATDGNSESVNPQTYGK